MALTTLCIVKTMATEHHGINTKARQTHSKEVGEAVYHKSMLHNYHMQHAKFHAINYITFSTKFVHS